MDGKNPGEQPDVRKMDAAIPVKGMRCKDCAEKIASRVGLLEGVDSVSVDLLHDKVHVTFDPDSATLDSIKSEIESLGYSVSGAHVKRSFAQGLAYGLVPHVGCIAFIIASVAGATALMQYFKPLLMNPYFFHILIGISFAFATLSSALYLRSNGMLSLAGMRKKRLYLSTMYGSTIGVNALLFLVIFPMLANVSSVPLAAAAGDGITGSAAALAWLKISVAIPCSGHAPLITDELKAVDGVKGVQFSMPNAFEVTYDSTKVTKETLLGLEVFKTYKATLLDQSAVAGVQQLTALSTAPSGQAGGSCCGSGGSCGSAGGSCGGSCGKSCSCGRASGTASGAA